VHDCVTLEQRGIPTVSVTSRPFVPLSDTLARSLGLPGLRRALVQPVLTDLPAGDVPAVVAAAADDVVAGLTAPIQWTAQADAVALLGFVGDDLLDACDAMNREFLAQGWSDGLPLVPPTPARVEAMLAAARNPEEVLGALPPARGVASLRAVAANAVMAGCRPEHLPVVAAAVRALADPTARLGEIAASTNPDAPLLIVNGPIRRELGINCGRGALGPGALSYANTVIGRAVRLVIMNVAGSYLDVTDMDTLGTPNKYSLCIGENEEESPWAPLHVERGFAAEASTVTVVGVQSLINASNANCQRPEDILTTYAHSGNAAGVTSTRLTPYAQLGKQNFLLLPPDHARTIGRAGWSRQDVREYMYAHTCLPVGVIKLQAIVASIPPDRQALLAQPDNTPVPCCGGPGEFEAVVVGGPVGKGAYAAGMSLAVTRAIVR
jgi:hypothetical protein